MRAPRRQCAAAAHAAGGRAPCACVIRRTHGRRAGSGTRLRLALTSRMRCGRWCAPAAWEPLMAMRLGRTFARWCCRWRPAVVRGVSPRVAFSGRRLRSPRHVGSQRVSLPDHRHIESQCGQVDARPQGLAQKTDFDAIKKTICSHDEKFDDIRLEQRVEESTRSATASGASEMQHRQQHERRASGMAPQVGAFARAQVLGLCTPQRARHRCWGARAAARGPCH